MITFSCDNCGQQYRLPENLAGKTARCKKCGEAMPIPNALAPRQAEERQREAAAPAAKSASSPPASQKKGNRSKSTVRGTGEHFDYEISHRPDFAMVTVHLNEGEKVYAEPAAMAAMSPEVTLKAGFKGGIGKTLGRAFGGESMIVNTFTAEHGAGEITFAPGIAGDAEHYQLGGGTLLLQRGAFMVHSEGVEISGKWKGAKGFFSGEGLVLLKATGYGDIFFNSYGAILSVDVTDEYVVDTGYIVAFEDTLDYRVTILPGLRSGGKLKTLFFGGEGLVCRFRGQGRVWIQTRHVQSFLSWINAFRPTSSN